MNSKDHMLAIDYGTQSVRALLFDHGEIWSSAGGGRTLFLRQPRVGGAGPGGHVAVGCARPVKRCGRKSPVARDAVAAVALTTQRATMINVDGMGEPLRPAILWLDQRRM